MDINQDHQRGWVEELFPVEEFPDDDFNNLESLFQLPAAPPQTSPTPPPLPVPSAEGNMELPRNENYGWFYNSEIKFGERTTTTYPLKFFSIPEVQSSTSTPSPPAWFPSDYMSLGTSPPVLDPTPIIPPAAATEPPSQALFKSDEGGSEGQGKVRGRRRRKNQLVCLKCPACGKVFKDSSGLKRHSKGHSDDPASSFPCLDDPSNCTAKFVHKTSLTKHRQLAHGFKVERDQSKAAKAKMQKSNSNNISSM